MEPIIIEERFGAFQFAVALILAYDFGTLHRNKVLKIKMVSKFQDNRSLMVMMYSKGMTSFDSSHDPSL